MGLFDRLRGRRRVPAPAAGGGDGRAARAETTAHLAEFARSRVGVEGYVEPATAQNPVTLMLVATDGEWTRRRVPDERAGHALARELGIPVYDVQRVGYPQRVRDWNSRQRILARRTAAERAARRAAERS
ncbi:oxidoreductase [Cellulomonas marina]|uniref:Uncharacterized protein n=1 Tax=Cellulomonas marina TaxID=988821 RepID=A0A1I0VZU5_9CELL|nr:oxidoreductase [Cellulomonas marina]GIG27446.1 hypothetical protein Cma02nite_00460 [Cellulomonas marina]SFA81728.1 hypothetical protein SAMN05421867_10268 [Cellulomonas marina]